MKRNSRDPVGKAIEALVWLTETDRSYVGVRELAAAIGMSPSNVHRILHALTKLGLVSRDADGQRYGLGVEFFRIAQRGIKKLPVREAAVAAMRRLVDACNETALLALYDRGRQEMFFAASIESSYALRYSFDLNKWMPLHTGASGLAILAFLSDAEIASFLRHSPLAPLTDRSITDPMRLKAELARVRQEGFSVTWGHRITGAVGLAAPIFDGTGQVIGDVCINIPELRFDKSKIKVLLASLLESVKEISERIAGAASPPPPSLATPAIGNTKTNAARRLRGAAASRAGNHRLPNRR
jgi:DNA-binding IclR family transcriptional regulator